MPLSSLFWSVIIHSASVFRCLLNVEIRRVTTPSQLFFFLIRWFSTFRGRVMSLMFRILNRVRFMISFSFPRVFRSLIVLLCISLFLIMPSFLVLVLLCRWSVISVAFFLVFLVFFGFLFFFSFLFLCFIPGFTIFYTTSFKFLSLLKTFSYRICITFLSWLELFVSVIHELIPITII